jgi:hypothetical protein
MKLEFLQLELELTQPKISSNLYIYKRDPPIHLNSIKKIGLGRDLFFNSTKNGINLKWTVLLNGQVRIKGFSIQTQFDPQYFARWMWHRII